MLIDETSVWRNPRTGVLERVFPSDFAPPGFRSVSPSVDELRDWLLDPVILSQLRTSDFVVNRDNFANLPLDRLEVLNALRLVDYARAQEARVFELASKVGLIRGEDLQALAPTAHAMIGSLIGVLQTAPDMLAEELAGKAAFEFYRVVSSFAASFNPYVVLAVQIIGFGKQVYDALRSARAGEVDLPRLRMPLHTQDARKRSDDARVTAMRTVMAGGRDWTELFMPAFTGDWAVRELGEPRPGRQGFGVGMVEGSGEAFTPSGGWGVMPGTSRCLDQLQYELRWRSVRDSQDDLRDKRGRPLTPTAGWTSHYCNAKGDPCGQSPDDFDGKIDCRQCIPVDSIRGSSRGDWREWSFSYVSDITNVGDWLVNSTQALTSLWDGFSVTNPATYCIHAEQLHDAWRRTWEQFFDAFIPRAWAAHDAWAWRAVISRFAAWALISREDGELGGRGTLLDWRVRSWGAEQHDGIELVAAPPIPPVYSGCPVDDPTCAPLPDILALRRISPTPFLLEHSVWKQAIEPAVRRLGRLQLAGYQTTACAYLWLDQGAHADPATGKRRNNQAGKAFDEGLRQILNTARLRNAVHMGHVVDPQIRKLLLEAGARPFQTGANRAPAPEVAGADGRPPRAQVSPDDQPIQPFDDRWIPPEPAAPPRGGFPSEIPAGFPATDPSAPMSRSTRRARALGVTAGATAAGLLGWWGLRQLGARARGGRS